jgi:hypothetical protein
MARTDKINRLLETMENSTNLFLIPITLIVIAFVCRWVKDFGASDKSQAVYELAAWLDSLGLRLTVTVKPS